MEKINVAELLKDCPKGMELDCILCNNVVTLEGVEKEGYYPIKVMTKSGYNHRLTCEGYVYKEDDAKCVIYPKGKTTWEGFVPPCKFKDGDIVATTRGSWIGITKGGENNSFIPTYCVINCNDEFEAYFDRKEQWSFSRLATEEEKQKLFQAIKDNGYKWNAETKTLEKLIEPKFKVGDKIKHKTHTSIGDVVTEIKDTHYILDDELALPFVFQDEYELVPNKFDITTLKPFDKVLVRDKSNEVWTANFYSHYDATSDKPFICVGWSEMNEYSYCIPYEANKDLLGTTNNPKEHGSN